MTRLSLTRAAAFAALASLSIFATSAFALPRIDAGGSPTDKIPEAVPVAPTAAPTLTPGAARTTSSGASLDELYAQLGAPRFDPAALTAVRANCRESGSNVTGNLVCESSSAGKGFLDTVEEMVEADLSGEVTDYYNGMWTDYLTNTKRASSVPVCNASDAELTQNKLGSSSPFSSCGNTCEFKAKCTKRFFGKCIGAEVKMLPDTQGRCTREYSWVRGAYPQLLAHYRDQVVSKFKQQRTVDLFEPTPGAARPCAGIAADAQSINEVVNVAVEKLTAEIGEKAAAAAKCRASNNKSADPTSHGACYLTGANTMHRMLWTKLLVCEIRWRAQSEFGQAFQEQKFVDSAQSYITGKCKNKKSESSLNSCYKNNIPSFYQQKTNAYSTIKQIPYPRQPKAALMFGGAAIPFAGLGRRRKWRSISVLLVILALSLSVILGGGCSGGANIDACAMACKPCGDTSVSGCNCPLTNCEKSLDSFTIPKSYTSTANSVDDYATADASSGQIWVQALNQSGAGEIARKRQSVINMLADKSLCTQAAGPVSDDGNFTLTTTCRNDLVSKIKENFSSNVLVDVDRATACAPPKGFPIDDAKEFCPGNNVENGGPEMTGVNIAAGAATSLADFYNVFGYTPKTVKGKNPVGGVAATMGGPIPQSTSGSRKRGGAGTGTLPNFSALAQPASDGKQGSGGFDSGSGGSNKMADLPKSGSATVTEEDAAKVAPKVVGLSPFAAVGSPEAGPKRSNLFSSLGSSGTTGPVAGRPSTVAYGTKTGIAGDPSEDLDTYLKRMGEKMSLFQVVNQRMDRWGREQ